MKRFISAVVAALTLAFSATIITANTAFAHDEIVSTTPVADSKVAPGELKLAVVFNEDVMNIPPHQGVSFSVTDPNGEPTLLDCVEINGAEINSAFLAETTGTYTIDWRSVSNDGHANSGTYSFEVADGAKAGEAPAPDSACAAKAIAATSDATEKDLTTYTPTAAATDSGSKLDPIAGLGMGIGLFVVLSVLGALAAELQKRRRARKAELKKLKAEVEANPYMLRDI